MDAGLNHLHLFGSSSFVSAFSQFEAQHSIVRFSAQCLTLTHPQHSVSESVFRICVESIFAVKIGTCCFFDMESLQELCCGILHSEQLCVESIFAVKIGDLLFLG